MSFECIAPGVDEIAQFGETPLDLVERLARAKASAVSAQQPNAWVIGSDQIAALDGGQAPLGKPGTEARCHEQLRSCSGRTVEFVTAVAVMRRENNALIEFTDITRVTFRVLDELTIERYVVKEQPLDCAGGFKSEGLVRIDRQRGSKRIDWTALDTIECGVARRWIQRTLAFRGLSTPAAFRAGTFHGCDGIEHRGQFCGQRCTDVERYAGAGPFEGHRLCVQKCTLQSMRF